MTKSLFILLTTATIFWSCSSSQKEVRLPASVCNAGDRFCEAAVIALDKNALCGDRDADCKSLKSLLETSACSPVDRLCLSVRQALIENKCSYNDGLCRSAKDALNGKACNYTDTTCMSLKQADFTRKNLKNYYTK